MDSNRVMEILPHRYPFILIDRVLEVREGTEPEKSRTGRTAVATKNVTINEPFFMGHFPGEPIMPGVLMVEALAQVGGVLALVNQSTSDKLAFFMTIDNVKFRKPAVPGDQLVMNVTVITSRASILKTHGEITVDGKLICEGDFMFSIVDKDKVQ